MSIIIIFSILLVPVSVFCVGFSSFHPYEDTYYAGLKNQIEKLDSSKKKKIVLLGTSSVAFGICSKLFEEELQHVSLDYDVIPFGLYGSLGTKLMIELCKDKIRQDDIIIFQPELTSQTLSTYFSSKETYRSFDSELDLIGRLDKEDKKKMLLNFASFASEKYSFLKQGKKASPSDVYDIRSFDENGDLTYLRENNIMDDYYDIDNIVDLEEVSIEEEFSKYVKDFASMARRKKASIYFHYCPVNRKALKNETDVVIEKSMKQFQDAFNMEVMGNPHDAFMDKEFFYDTNFHLNSAGMKNYTLTLASEIKSLFNITKPSLNQKENPPALIDKEEQKEEYDNKDIDCFIYEKEEDGYMIKSLSKEGLAKSSLVIPGKYCSKPIRSIDVTALQNQSRLKVITFQNNITRLRDGMFENTPIEKIIIKQKDPTKISVGFKLFENISPEIIIPKGTLSSYIGNYSWSYYGQYLKEDNL